MALSQPQLLEKLNYKNWISTAELEIQLNEDSNLLTSKLNKLYKYGFVEKKVQERASKEIFMGARSHFWRRLKESSKTKK